MSHDDIGAQLYVFFPAVSQNVISQHILMTKSLVALGTFVQLLSTVNQQMTPQMCS